MADGIGEVSRHLIVNRAELIFDGCSACGQNLASDPPGARALHTSVGPHANYVFCAACGDSIMMHLQVEAVRKCYVWDWVIPLRGEPLASIGLPA